MPPLSAYTPFESLLFVQSLAKLDARPANFASISNFLRENTFIRQNVSFNAERLSPEALEDLYATLMRDDSEIDDTANKGVINGRRADSSGPSSPKRRKISNPQVEKLGDGISSHTLLVPKLVSRLYAAYKEFVTKEIRSDERRYNELRHEVESLQREELEEQKAKEDHQIHPTPSVPPVPIPELAPGPTELEVKEQKPHQISPKEPPVKEPVEHPINHEAAVESISTQAGGQETNDTQQPTKPAVSPLQPRPPPQMQAAQNPLVAPLVQEPQNETMEIQSKEQSHIQHPPPNITSQPASVQHPSVKEKSTPQTSPRQPLAPTNDEISAASAHRQAQPPPIPPPITSSASPGTPAVASHQGVPQAAQVPVASPAQQSKRKAKEVPPIAIPTTAPQRFRGQPAFHQWSLNEPQASHQQIPSYSTTPKANGMFIGQPSTVQPSTPQGTTESQAKGVRLTPRPPLAPSATPGQIPSTTRSPVPTSQLHETPTVTNKTPSVLGSENIQPPQPSATTPLSVTPWKKPPRLSIPLSPTSPRRPLPEDISPISERAPSPVEKAAEVESGPEPEPEPEKSATRKRGQVGRKRKQSTEQTARSPETEVKPTRNSKSSDGRKRDGSTPSSRSAASHDQKTSPGTVSHEIKQEVSNATIETPKDIEHEPSRVSTRLRSATTSTPTDDRQPTRGRPKRKRTASEEAEASQNQPPAETNRTDTSHAPQYVLCTRNFPRTGAPIMNDVSTHKHASTFTKPLTEKEAPGYRDLIYRPQDLKSIKSALSHGSKAVGAATEAASTPATTDGDSPAPSAGATPSKNAVLMLQKAEDIIPPKGIVNSSQLEKELIRMFANAIMFNPVPQRGFGPAFPMTAVDESGHEYPQESSEGDEGGIIKDTHEMFDDVESAVTKWRTAERSAEELSNKSIVPIRKGSVSEVHTDGADDGKG